MNLRVLTTKRSPRGFLIVPVHLRHDPDKTEEWEMRERAKYASEADANRELDFDTREVLGAPAYPAFKYGQHVTDQMEGMPFSHLPLCLSMDFNVSPMVWNISQIVSGKLFVFDEIYIDPADAGMMIQAFRNKYPAHRADLYIYGDATGTHRSPNSLQSCYDLVSLGLRGYPSTVVWKVPVQNPPVRDRLAAVNNKFKGAADGRLGIYIHERCKHLIADFEEVVLEKGGNQIHKANKADDPYRYRTHASDGLGYLIYREWPVFKELVETKRRDRQKKHRTLERKYARVIGAI